VTSTVDTIRAIFTYAIAFVVVVGGGAVIYLTRNDPQSSDTVAIVAGFVGSALTFVFGSEVQTRTARQSQTSSMAGATMHANGLATTPVSVTHDPPRDHG
jgi:hypothetical protein